MAWFCSLNTGHKVASMASVPPQWRREEEEIQVTALRREAGKRKEEGEGSGDSSQGENGGK